MPTRIADVHPSYRPANRNHPVVPTSASGRVSRAWPVHTVARNCTRDEGRPFGFGDQVADPKPPRSAAVKSRGDERRGNAGTTIPGRDWLFEYNCHDPPHSPPALAWPARGLQMTEQEWKTVIDAL